MRRYCEGVYYKNNVKEATIRKYVLCMKHIPEVWRKKFINDGWTVYFRAAEYQGIKLVPQYKIVEIKTNQKNLILNTLIYKAFSKYIRARYEEVKYSKAILQFNEKYKDVLEKMDYMIGVHPRQNTFTKLIYFYCEKQYGRKFFEQNDIMDMYTYIDEWMTLKVFDIQNPTQYKFKLEKDITKESARVMEKAINSLPDGIFNQTKKDGIEYFLTTNFLDYFGKDEVNYAGVFSRRKRKIGVKEQSDIEDTLFHEVGHYIHYKFIILLKIAEEIYEAEKNKYDIIMRERCNQHQINYFKQDSKEFYAQAFAEYFLNRGMVKKNMPRTYTLMKTIEKVIVLQSKAHATK